MEINNRGVYAATALAASLLAAECSSPPAPGSDINGIADGQLMDAGGDITPFTDGFGDGDELDAFFDVRTDIQGQMDVITDGIDGQEDGEDDGAGGDGDGIGDAEGDGASDSAGFPPDVTPDTAKPPTDMEGTDDILPDTAGATDAADAIDGDAAEVFPGEDVDGEGDAPDGDDGQGVPADIVVEDVSEDTGTPVADVVVTPDTAACDLVKLCAGETTGKINAWKLKLEADGHLKGIEQLFATDINDFEGVGIIEKCYEACLGKGEVVGAKIPQSVMATCKSEVMWAEFTLFNQEENECKYPEDMSTGGGGHQDTNPLSDFPRICLTGDALKEVVKGETCVYVDDFPKGN